MPAVLSDTAASSAATSFGGTKWTPGSSGPKPRRTLSCPVIDTAPSDRPWKEPSREMISYFSSRIAVPWARIILMPPSIASAPELQKKLRFNPLISANFFASGAWYS